jgi:hypothetical protein
MTTTTAQLEATVRAGGDVSPAELLAAQASDRLAVLRGEGDATTARLAAVQAREAAIDKVLADLAVAADPSAVDAVNTKVVAALRVLVELADTRAAAIVAATNALRSLGAIGGGQRAQAWSGQLTDMRAGVNYLELGASYFVLAALRESVPQNVRFDIRNSQNF